MSSPTVAPPEGRDRILAAALALMSAEGAAAVSMRQLARACDLNVATLYHYFPSKEDLLRSLIEERNYQALLEVGLPVDRSLEPRDRLARLLTDIWSGAVGDRDVWRLVIGESLRANVAAAEVAAELVSALRTSLAGWLAEGFPELAERGTEPSDGADLLSGQVFGFFIEILVLPRSPTEAQAYLEGRARQIADFVFGR